MSVCRIHFLGNVGRDPEVRYTKGGTSVTSFSVAVNQSTKTPEGWQEATDWFRVTVFGEAGERAAEQLRKGSRVFVEGDFSSREWESKADGLKRTSLEVKASKVVPLDRAERSAAPGGSTTGTEGADDLSALPF